MKKNAIRSLVAAMAFAGLSYGAHANSNAEVFDGVTGKQVQTILQQQGYRAELTKDSQGDPMIKTSMGGFKNVLVFFYNCNAGVCADIQFSAAMNLQSGTNPDQVEAFNRKMLVGKVSLDDENDPFLRSLHSVRGGVTADNIAFAANRYSRALELFKKHFGWA